MRFAHPGGRSQCKNAPTVANIQSLTHVRRKVPHRSTHVEGKTVRRQNEAMNGAVTRHTLRSSR